MGKLKNGKGSTHESSRWPRKCRWRSKTMKTTLHGHLAILPYSSQQISACDLACRYAEVHLLSSQRSCTSGILHQVLHKLKLCAMSLSLSLSRYTYRQVRVGKGINPVGEWEGSSNEVLCGRCYEESIRGQRHQAPRVRPGIRECSSCTSF